MVAWSSAKDTAYARQACRPKIALYVKSRIQDHSGHYRPIGVSRNPERGVAVMHNNANIVSETEDIAKGKLQIRRFQLSHSGLTTVLPGKPFNIYR